MDSDQQEHQHQIDSAERNRVIGVGDIAMAPIKVTGWLARIIWKIISFLIIVMIIIAIFGAVAYVSIPEFKEFLTGY